MAGRHRRRPGGGEGAPEKVGGLPCETLSGAPVRAELQSSAALHEQAPLEEFRLVNHQLFLSTGLLHGLRRGQGEGQRVLAGILRHRRGWWPWEDASLVLVAREKESGRVVGYCRADHGDEELRIAQLKAPVFQGGFLVKLRRCGLSPDLLSFEVLLLSEPLLTLLPAAPEVHGDHQGKGVGKLLIQAAETQAGKGQRVFKI